MKTYAHADRKGLISLTTKPDEAGLIQIGSGGKGFRQKVETLARHGYCGELLVPGVPEAASDDDALIALSFFRDWLAGGDAKELLKLHDIRGVHDRALKAAFA